MNTMSFIKGMGAGLVVGACAGMAMAPDKKSAKKKLGKAVKAVGEMIEGITDTFSF